MNTGKIISPQSHGAEKQLLQRIFAGLVGSRLAHGSVAYGSATNAALKMLYRVLQLGLRLACGAFRTSPFQSLHFECDQWCLEYQRAMLTCFMRVKLHKRITIPNISVHNGTSTTQLFSNRPTISACFSERVSRKQLYLMYPFRTPPNHVSLILQHHGTNSVCRVACLLPKVTKTGHQALRFCSTSYRCRTNTRVRKFTVTLPKLPPLCQVLWKGPILMFIGLLLQIAQF